MGSNRKEKRKIMKKISLILCAVLPLTAPLRINAETDPGMGGGFIKSITGAPMTQQRFNHLIDAWGESDFKSRLLATLFSSGFQKKVNSTTSSSRRPADREAPHPMRAAADAAVREASKSARGS